MAPATALSLPLFSADLRALDAGSVGLSIFLLVSVRVGDRRFRAAGDRLPETENLKHRCAGGVSPCCPAAVERRCNASAAYRRVT